MTAMRFLGAGLPLVIGGIVGKTDLVLCAMSKGGGQIWIGVDVGVVR